jgi:hypothetical protein
MSKLTRQNFGALLLCPSLAPVFPALQLMITITFPAAGSAATAAFTTAAAAPVSGLSWRIGRLDFFLSLFLFLSTSHHSLVSCFRVCLPITRVLAFALLGHYSSVAPHQLVIV